MNNQHVRRKEGERKASSTRTGISREGENLGAEQVQPGCVRDELLCETGTADSKGCRSRWFFGPKKRDRFFYTQKKERRKVLSAMSAAEPVIFPNVNNLTLLTELKEIR
jgi:hypothetical protein